MHDDPHREEPSGWTPRDPTRTEVMAVAVVLVVGGAAFLWFTGGDPGPGLLIGGVVVAVGFVGMVVWFALEAWWVNRGVRRGARGTSGDVGDSRDAGGSGNQA